MLETSTKKENVERFINDTVRRNDIVLIDILWTFFYSIPSMSGYHNNKGDFEMWFGRICARNLQKRYNLRRDGIKERMKFFINFLNNLHDFLSKESFDEDYKLLGGTLISKTSGILVQNVRNKIPSLSNLDKKVLSFVLHYIPMRIQASIEKAERKRRENPNYKGKYEFLFDLHVEENSFTISDYGLRSWTYIFNLLFDEELRKQKVKPKVHGRAFSPVDLLRGRYNEYSFYQLGDELVKIGVGYWSFYISAKGNVHIEFAIPRFIYEAIKDCKSELPIIENFEEKINKIEEEIKAKGLGERWGLEDFEGVFEGVTENSEILESEIEASIMSNPEILEEGLEFVGNQYSTPVGYIDILCRDKNGNFVVVELKRGAGSYEVVGQIQKYMAWVSENLAEGKGVRGIIVVKEGDQGLEYAVKGSRFPIEIKVFGQEPPVEENVKYCTRCGKPNPKSAKYCIKCGQKFWM